MFDYDPFSKRQNDCFKNVQVESTIESLLFSDDGVWKMSFFLSNVRNFEFCSHVFRRFLHLVIMSIILFYIFTVFIRMCERQLLFFTNSASSNCVPHSRPQEDDCVQNLIISRNIDP